MSRKSKFEYILVALLFVLVVTSFFVLDYGNDACTTLGVIRAKATGLMIALGVLGIGYHFFFSGSLRPVATFMIIGGASLAIVFRMHSLECEDFYLDKLNSSEQETSVINAHNKAGNLTR